MKLYRNKDWLQARYIDNRLSPRKIAPLCGVCATTIDNWLARHHIPIRSLGEAAFADRGHSLIISPWMSQFIDGEMLGDGSIWSYNTFSGIYQHTNKHKGYLEWLKDIFAQEHIECGNIHHGTVRAPAGKPAKRFLMASLSYDFLRQIYERWYPNGIKRKAVPMDLIIDSIALRQWYLGDGWLASKRGKYPAPYLAVHGFSKPEQEHLCQLLRDLGFDLHLDRNSSIRIKTGNVEDFFKFIGPIPSQLENIYGYKWPCGMNKAQWLISREVRYAS